MVVQAVLLSPKFLFRPEIGDRSQEVAQGVPLTSWEMAARLSYFLTGSLPDAELAAAADADKLRSSDELVKQARRLLTSQRAQTNLVRFHLMWLGTDTTSSLAKNENAFPDFNPLLAYYMAKETDQFLRKTLFENNGTFADMLLADHTYVNGPLAEFYGVAGPTGNDVWEPVKLDPSKRVGLLTQASLLATMAKEDRTDPVRRGKFVLNQILCRSVNPPSPEIVAMFKPLDLSKTAREQFTGPRRERRVRVVPPFPRSARLAVRALRRHRALARRRSRDGAGRQRGAGRQDVQRRARDGAHAVRDARRARLLRGGVASLLAGQAELRSRPAVRRLADDAVHAQHARDGSGGRHRRQRHVPVPQTGGGGAMSKVTKKTDKKMQAAKPERRTPRTLSRRALLKGALGVGVALPWLELMRPRGLRASAGVPAPKRFGVFFSPCGTIPENWRPTQPFMAPDTDFTLSPIL